MVFVAFMLLVGIPYWVNARGGTLEKWHGGLLLALTGVIGTLIMRKTIRQKGQKVKKE